MSILQDIYNDSYYPCEPLEHMPKALRDKQLAFYEKIEEAMGVEFMEQHWDDLCEIDRFRDFTNFRQGFRLGVSLMLELL